jgi:acyl dehydratase
VSTVPRVTRHLNGLEELKANVGEHLGYSEWKLITQEQVNLFAEATGDHQWIHTDPERAKKGPFGGAIAHGYLTLSLLPALLPEVAVVDGIKLAVNYGAGKVRFPSPVPVGARVRVGAKVGSVEETTGGFQVSWDTAVEVEGAAKPALVAEVIYRYMV